MLLDPNCLAFHYTTCIINIRDFVISLVPEQKLHYIAGQEKLVS